MCEFFSLVGGIGVILGLYILLWGKANDVLEIKEQSNPELQDSAQSKQVDHEDSPVTEYSCKIDLEEPLLFDKSILISGQEIRTY